MRWRPLLGFLVPVALALGSCQRLDLCEGGMCEAASGGSDNAVSGRGGAPSSGGTTETAGAVAAGEAGQAGAGGDEPEPLSCEPGLADCDESRLTGCETHLAWTVRHCGSCGQECDEACQDNRCLATRVISAGVLGAFVSTGSYAFAELWKFDSSSALIRIDIKTGMVDELLRLADFAWFTLAIGDRVYLLQDYGPLRSFALDGEDPRIEDVVEPEDIGAYPGGTYYLSTVYDEEDVGTDTLYFRPSNANAWQAIRQQETRDTTAIWSSSDHGVVYVEPDTTDSDQLYLLRGEELVPFGALPAHASHALAIRDGAREALTVLTHDTEAQLSELWWLTADGEPVHYALPFERYAPDMRAFLSDKVAVLLSEGVSAYVQPYSASGTFGGRIGVRGESYLHGMSDTYLFHSESDDWVHSRVLQTPWDYFAP